MAENVELELTPDLAARVAQAVFEVEAMDNRRTRAHEELKKFAARLTGPEHDELEIALKSALQTEIDPETEG